MRSGRKLGAGSGKFSDSEIVGKEVVRLGCSNRVPYRQKHASESCSPLDDLLRVDAVIEKWSCCVFAAARSTMSFRCRREETLFDRLLKIG